MARGLGAFPYFTYPTLFHILYPAAGPSKSFYIQSQLWIYPQGCPS
jgi:hypothetical protein